MRAFTIRDGGSARPSWSWGDGRSEAPAAARLPELRRRRSGGLSASVRCRMPLVLDTHLEVDGALSERQSARARSSRSWPRASSSRSPAPATRPRPSSSRDCCSRRACRACCAGARASTSPTSSPPARATARAPVRGGDRPRRAAPGGADLVRPRAADGRSGAAAGGLLAALAIGALVVWLIARGGPLTVLSRRLAAQLLAGEPAPDPVVGDQTVARRPGPGRPRFQARDQGRTRQGLTVAAVEKALTEDRTLLITWLCRGTLHLIRSEDYPWLHVLTTPPLLTGNLRRLDQTGVSAGAPSSASKRSSARCAARGR